MGELKRTYPSFLDGEEFVEHNNTGGPRHVPGIHLAVNFERLPSIQFSHGFGQWKQERLTPAEIAMIQLINDITEEEDWHIKVREFDTVQRWKMTAMSLVNLNPDTWDWCLFELMAKAADYSQRSESILALDAASRIFKTDRFAKSHLFESLTNSTLGRSISPWLYPFIYAGSPIRTDGKTINLDNLPDRIGGASVPPKPFWDNDCWSGEEHYYSKTSQWLAADIKFTDDSVRFCSPINNLHPLQHRPLYSAIETLISESLSEWDHVLLFKSLQRNGPRIMRPTRRCQSCIDMNIDCSCTIKLNKFADWLQGNISPGLADPPDNENWSALSAMNGTYTNSKKLYGEICLRKGFANRGLQVYIELANLELKVDGTVPKESSQRLRWTLSGNRNERIVATTLICLRRENIQEDSGQISFRSEIKPEGLGDKAASDCRHATQATSQPAVISATPTSPLFQELVTISMHTGRAITIPNALQHKFERLKLVDESQNGSLQFLAVHLVDPHYVLCSTRHVPPQSVSWWWEAAKLGFLFRKYKVPTEMRRLIADYAIGKGCGHSIEDDDSDNEEDEAEDDEDEAEDDEDEAEDDEDEDGVSEDVGNGDDSDGNDVDDHNDDDGDSEEDDFGVGESGLTKRSRFMRDNSPEKLQEEKPIRIEAAVRMRDKALDRHGEVMDALNGLRIFGVAGHHRVWFRQTSNTSVPLDHADSEEEGYPIVNAAIGDDGTVARAPESSEDDEEDSSDEDSDDGWNNLGQNNDGQNSSQLNADDDNGVNNGEMTQQGIMQQDAAQEVVMDEQIAEEQIAEQLYGEQFSSEESAAEPETRNEPESDDDMKQPS
ncbi:hypothetical protein PWT90_06999 [Aphanocladium album]|nr:hypothetical protein PWT90_06999 [Aphanocladium album]